MGEGGRGSGGKRDRGEGRREGEECARNFAPIFAFHMRINTTEYRIGMNWTIRISLYSELIGESKGTHT